MGAPGDSLSLALGIPVIPLGLMRVKRTVTPKAQTSIELGSGSKPEKKKANAGAKSTDNSDAELTSDDGILEIYTGKV